MKTRWPWLLAIFVSLTGCMHWASISSVDEVAGACRVRVSSDDRPPVVLERPTVAEVTELVHGSQHARVEIRKVNAWATALIATGGFLASVFTGFVILAVAVAGTAGG